MNKAHWFVALCMHNYYGECIVAYVKHAYDCNYVIANTSYTASMTLFTNIMYS